MNELNALHVLAMVMCDDCKSAFPSNTPDRRSIGALYQRLHYHAKHTTGTPENDLKRVLASFGRTEKDDCLVCRRRLNEAVERMLAIDEVLDDPYEAFDQWAIRLDEQLSKWHAHGHQQA